MQNRFMDMRTLEVNKNTIEVFDDIEQLTAERFSKFNKFMMLSDSLGNSFTDIDKVHLSKMYLVVNDPAKIRDEINNMRLLIYNILNEINPRSMAFACLVSSINGKDRTDISDAGIEQTRKEIEKTGITVSDLKKKLQELRDKIRGDLEMYFPANFDPNPVVRIPAFDSLKKHLIAKVEALIDPSEEREQLVKDTEKALGNFVRTNSFLPNDNDEIRHEKDFEKACVILSEHTNKDVKKMSVKEYFTLVDFVNEKNKKRVA